MTHAPDFDELIDRRGTHSSKWDMMEAELRRAGGRRHRDVGGGHGFPAAGLRAVGAGGHGGPWRLRLFRRRPRQSRRDRLVDEAAAWLGGRARPRSSPPTGWSTARRSASRPIPQPGDGVVLMTPVYHAFARIVRACGRRVVECPLALEDGRYGLDIAGWDALMTGSRADADPVLAA